MKIFLATIFLCTGLLHSYSFKSYVMDNKYFKCKYPENFKMERNKESDRRNKIYKVVFVDPSSQTTITIKYYSPSSGKDYKSFIELQSKTEDGKLESPTEKYEKVKEIEINGKKAYEINRKLLYYESIEAKSSSYWLKERIIVIPAKKGFYTLNFSVKESEFQKNNKIFNEVLSSFETLY